MKSQSYTPKSTDCIYIIIFFILLFAGCSQEEPVYQISVMNHLPVLATVSLDGGQEKEVTSKGTTSYSNVLGGSHILRAESSGFDPIEEIIYINRDVTWTIEEK
ncbi:MAG: hypothetical protein AAB116_23395 [Candidatus Poribacteria bacterium]